jgi:hypothetical protein
VPVGTRYGCCHHIPHGASPARTLRISTSPDSQCLRPGAPACRDRRHRRGRTPHSRCRGIPQWAVAHPAIDCHIGADISDAAHLVKVTAAAATIARWAPPQRRAHRSTAASRIVAAQSAMVGRSRLDVGPGRPRAEPSRLGGALRHGSQCRVRPRGTPN